MAVHARPAAFDGPDGMPYSVDILTDETGDAKRPYAAFLLFMKWRRMGEPGIDAHIETDFLAYGNSVDEARAALGKMPLDDVKTMLDDLVRGKADKPERRWWDAMRDEGNDEPNGRSA